MTERGGEVEGTAGPGSRNGAPETGAVGVVVGHAELARGLISAVSRISGVADGVLTPVSNEGRGPAELQEEIRGAMGARTVVFTDLGSGSCTLAARLSCRERGEVAVIAGVNLPMLLDFVFNRELPLDALVSRLAEKGRAGIMNLPTG
jgi:mannose/fructose-specific phosphotransferase system component IIA